MTKRFGPLYEVMMPSSLFLYLKLTSKIFAGIVESGLPILVITKEMGVKAAIEMEDWGKMKVKLAVRPAELTPQETALTTVLFLTGVHLVSL